MNDRSCNNCNHTFRFPSDLKKHFITSFHCKKNNEDIELFFNNLNNKIKNKILTCIICNKDFSRKYTLERHLLNSKCNKNKYNTQTITKQELQILINQEANKILNERNNNESLSNSNIIINNNSNNNNIVNNNIINNTINIQHINPFGFEDVRTIPIPEMKSILNSGENAGFQIIKAIYNKLENKNFYKPNMSRPEIACLNTEFNLTIYKSKEFCDALFDRCIAFLHHMLFLCKNEYSKNTIKNIYENIEYIETTMRTEIYDKQLQNIIESEFRNNNLDNKDRIKKFIKEIKDNLETKQQSKSLLNNILTLNSESENEYKISITDEEINKVFGDPKLILGLNKRELIDEFHFKRFEDTKFYKFWKDRIINETTFINKCKTATIGDMKTIKQRQMKIELMLNIIKARSDNLNPGDQIILDVEGFNIEEIDDDHFEEQEI